MIPAPALLRWGAGLCRLGLLVHALFLPVSIAGTQIGLAAAAAGLLLAGLGGHRPRRTPVDAPIAAFIAAAVLSDLLSPLGPPAWERATLWRSALGFWLVAQGLWLPVPPGGDARAARAQPLLAAAAVGLCAASLVGLAQYGSGFDPVHALGLRAARAFVDAPGVPGRFAALGFFVSRLTFGNVAALLLCLFAASVGAVGSSWLRALLVAALLLGGAAVLLTFNRAAWIGLGVAAFLGVALRRRLARGPQDPALRRALLVSLSLAVAGLAALLSLHGGVRGRLLSAFDLGKNQDRLFLWGRALEIIRDHPLLGVGFANYDRALGPYYDRLAPAFPMRTWAHNSFLSILAETGPPGLLAVGWLVAAAGRGLWRGMLRSSSNDPRGLGPRLALGAACALGALGVIGQFHDVPYDTKVMYAAWFCLAIGLPGTAPDQVCYEETHAPLRRAEGDPRLPEVQG